MSARRVFLSLLAVAGAIGAATAQDKPTKPKADPEKRIVFVGNSYTFLHDLPAFVRALGQSEPKPRKLATTMLTKGGFTLEMHLAAQGPDAPSVVLRKQKPDFVILQEQSRRPFLEPAKMDAAAQQFARLCKQAKATPVWFLTWSRRNEPQLQKNLTDQYEKVHAKNGGLLAPVGRAWQLALAEDDELDLHLSDNSHPSLKGTYLTACVLHGTMFGGDVSRFPDRLTTTNPIGKDKVLIVLSPEQGKLLRSAAARALAERRSKRKTERQP